MTNTSTRLLKLHCSGQPCLWRDHGCTPTLHPLPYWPPSMSLVAVEHRDGQAEARLRQLGRDRVSAPACLPLHGKELMPTSWEELPVAAGRISELLPRPVRRPGLDLRRFWGRLRTLNQPKPAPGLLSPGRVDPNGRPTGFRRPGLPPPPAAKRMRLPPLDAALWRYRRLFFQTR